MVRAVFTMVLLLTVACTETGKTKREPAPGSPPVSGDQKGTDGATQEQQSGGVWTGGGGGEVISDLMNPWFVQNTTDVTVCAIVDPDAFHVKDGKLGVLPDAIEQALAYWKAEFAKAFVVGNFVKVATQQFHVAPLITASGGKPDGACPDDTRLTVQFGYATDAQLKWLKANGHESGRLIGMAVRTEYDRINLAAKGFIFIAGDTGPTALTEPSLIGNPWKRGTMRIIEVVKHELGHVFGIPHRGFSGNSVMAPDYPEIFVGTQIGDADLDGPRNDPFFAIEPPYTFRDACGDVRYGWRQFLGAPEADKCTRFEYSENRIDFYTGPTADAMTLRGTLTLDSTVTFQWEDSVRLFVTSDEKAIPIPDPNKGAGIAPLLAGPMFKMNERQGLFKSADGQLERKVEVTFNAMGLGYSQTVFRVEMNGKTYRNLDFVYGP